MRHQTLDQITQIAAVSPLGRSPSREARRERLRRLVMLLDNHVGPITLLSRMEYLPPKDRPLLRCEGSPLAIAFDDMALRREGLTGDQLGDARAFFGLSEAEAHHLFCDCHYGARVQSQDIARRVHAMAERKSFVEMLRAIWSRFVPA
jgi:hypothetical protein